MAVSHNDKLLLLLLVDRLGGRKALQSCREVRQCACSERGVALVSGA